MADYTVKKVTDTQPAIPEIERPAQYEFTTYRNAIDDKGETVSIVHRTNTVSLAQLQAELAVIQGKIDAISALEIKE